jgi:predicted alpha/beta superfamily hydrolase
MKLRLFVAVSVLVGGVIDVPSAEAQTLIQLPPVEIRRIDSKEVGDSFEIRVMLPPMIPGERARFPVVYMADATGGFVVTESTLRLMMLADVPRFIAVGIGYPGATDFLQTVEIRGRDLTQIAMPADPADPAWPIAGQLIPAVASGGASKFLGFVRDELMPFINANYPTDPANRAYFGHSLGGLFGLYTLFTKPDTFTRYIIGSPSAWWGGEDVLKLATAYVKTHDDLSATVFIGIGALEENASSHMVTNFLRLETMLRTRKYSGLQLTTRIFADETHVTVYPMNLVRGLVSVFGRPAPEDALLAKFNIVTKPASPR